MAADWPILLLNSFPIFLASSFFMSRNGKKLTSINFQFAKL